MTTANALNARLTTPNILLITDDQHRWDFYSSRQFVPTLQVPALEGLQDDGVTLTNTFTNCPICMPTRFTWTYGLYASQAAAQLAANAHDWPTTLPSMPQALQRQGYHTALIGKLHSLQGLFPRDLRAEEAVTHARGFDDVMEVSGKELAYWYECRWTDHLRAIGQLDRYRAGVRQSCWAFNGAETGAPTFLSAEDSIDGIIGRQARQWLSSYTGEQPFYLHASFCGPHNPYDPVREYAERYRPEEMPAPPGITDPAAIQHWQRLQAAYCALITQIDDEIGRLLEQLDARGLRENTLVIFATDHGDMMGHFNRGTKGPPYDTSTRTPYLLRWPGVMPAGVVRDEMVEAVDLPATILHAAGLGADPRAALPNSPGRSFLDYAAGAGEHHRAWAFTEFGSLASGGWRMCRERDWKYVRQPAGDLLFDMAHDPWECDNLIDDPAQAARLSRMRGQLIDSLATCQASDTVVAVDSVS